VPPPSLAPLRLKLTVWYLATLCGILVLLGGGLFVTIRRQFAHELDASLRDAAARLEGAARIREEEAGAGARVVDAVVELKVPDRTLYLLDTLGRPVIPDSADAWIRSAAVRAWRAGEANLAHRERRDSVLRLHAERFILSSGKPMVAVAVADRVELEDRYSALIAEFGGAALVALVLVAAGGWLLVRQATAPIERNITRMQQFMADAAHELRTPVTVLRTRAEVALQRERDAAGYVATLEGIESESRRLGRIVDDLLLLARSDVGERPITRARVFLDDVVMDAAGAAGVVAAEKGIELAVARFDEAAVDGDSDLLRQLVMILLDNAIKFTPGGGRIDVTVAAHGDGAELRVADSGSGISANDLPHIFERFYRGDPARSRAASPADSDAGAASGAGLGLSIARWICDAHGATIAVESALDSGTTVMVTFARSPGGEVSSS